MVLPDSVLLCDAVELAAIVTGKSLFEKDLSKQFFPSQNFSDVEAELKDVLYLARMRKEAIPGQYPFSITDRSITFDPPTDFNPYLFLLLGSALGFGGPLNVGPLKKGFERFFEDIISWSLRNAGFKSEVLSTPRKFRGLDAKLAPALRQISDRFSEMASLREDRLLPHDNDLDVDVLAVPIMGNKSRGGWPTFQIQCATGAIENLQSKLEEGSATFNTVWEAGFYPGSRIRAVATPDDLLKLEDVHWLRLGQSGWVLDRTRIVHLSSGANKLPLIKEVSQYWDKLWAARDNIAWQTGWQKS